MGNEIYICTDKNGIKIYKELRGKRYYLLTTCPVSTDKQ
jgi:hypothetical protein